MTGEEFVAAALDLVSRLKSRYSQLTENLQKFIVHLPSL